MSLIYKQYLEYWLLERDGFRLNLIQFSSLFSDFHLSGLSMTHVHAERLIQSPAAFLDGWRHICPEMIFSRQGLAIFYTSTITVWIWSNHLGCHNKKLSHGLKVRVVYWEYPHLLWFNLQQVFSMDDVTREDFLMLELSRLLHINNHNTDLKQSPWLS